MRLLGLLVPAAVIAVVMLTVSRRATRRGDVAHPATPAPGTPARAPTASRGTPAEFLARWVAEGLVSADQARAILDHEHLPAPPPGPELAAHEPARPRRSPILAEALGYLGGVLAIAGLTLLVSNYWPDLSTPVRLALGSGTALLLGGAGAVVRERHAALVRLRWFLWALSSAAAALFTGVLMVDALGVDSASLIVGACAGTVAVVSGVLWQWRERPIQELLCVGGIVVGAAALVGAATNAGFGGLTAWALGVAALAGGMRDITPHPIVPHVVGALALVIGAFVTMSESLGAGLLFGTATAGGLLLLAALPRLELDLAKRVVLLVVGTGGAVQGLPQTLAHFSEQAGGATGLVTWSLGAVTLLAGTQRWLRGPIVAETIGGLGLLGGAALTAAQWRDVAPVLGLATALTLLAVGMRPGRVLYSLLGSLGLLINVPWAISTFFPGEGRAPLLITVSGLLIVAIAALTARQSDRFRKELTSHPRTGPGMQESHPGG